MKKKQSRMIIYIVLGAAGILGLIAVVMALILSGIDDTTPDTTPASPEQNKCNEIYVKVFNSDSQEAELITTDDIIPYGSPIIIGSRFQSPRPDGGLEGTAAVDYEYFEYTLNNKSDDTIQISVDDPEKAGTQQDGNFTYFITEFPFDDYELLGDSDTLQIVVTPYGKPFLDDSDDEIIAVSELTSVSDCLPVTYVIERDSDPTPSQCLEAGETGYEEDEPPCPLDENGEPISDCVDTPLEFPTCCEGLVKVNCSVLEDNQCTDPDPTCFRCLTDIEDGECSSDLGENYCNSPDDCEDEFTPAKPTDLACDAECTDDSECRDGLECNEGVCRDSNCPATQGCVCEEDEPAECNESCQSDADCSNELTCESGSCRNPECTDETTCECQIEPAACMETCSADAECDTGLTCEEGVCKNPECTSDTDCTCDDVEPPQLDTSNFSTSSSGPSCVERVSPNNVADFRITVSNSSDAYQELLQVKDKLPLGFTFTDGSAIINGTDDSTDQFISVSLVGETQELVWTTEGGWTIAPGEEFVIEFSAIAGENALTGDAINEVVITPQNNPVNEDTLRASHTFKVEQSCTTPETGLFDSLLAKSTLGIMAIILAAIFYYSSAGSRIAENLQGSSAYRSGSNATKNAVDPIRLLYLKLTEPRKHFEERFKREEKKGRAKKK